MAFQTDNSGLHSAGRAAAGEATHVLDVLNFLDCLIYSVFLNELYVGAEESVAVRESTINSIGNIYRGNDTIKIKPKLIGQPDLEDAADQAAVSLEASFRLGYWPDIKSPEVSESALHPNSHTILNQYESLHEVICDLIIGESDFLAMNSMASKVFQKGSANNVFCGVVGRNEYVFQKIQSTIKANEHWSLRDTILLETHVRTFFNTSLSSTGAHEAKCAYLPSTARALLARPYVGFLQRTQAAPLEFLAQIDGMVHKVAATKHWKNNPPTLELFAFPSLTAALLADASDDVESVISRARDMRVHNSSLNQELNAKLCEWDLMPEATEICETVWKYEGHLQNYLKSRSGWRVNMASLTKSKKFAKFGALNVSRAREMVNDLFKFEVGNLIERAGYEFKGKREVLAIGELAHSLRFIRDERQVREGFLRLCVAAGLKVDDVELQMNQLLWAHPKAN